MQPELPAIHEAQTPSGIAIADADQGTPHVVIHLAVINVFIHVWEEFDDGTPGGHNLYGFSERWREWAAGEEPYLYAKEPRFGFPVVIPRSAIDWVTQMTLEYRRREDVRAGHRSPLLAPHARQLDSNTIEVLIPR